MSAKVKVLAFFPKFEYDGKKEKASNKPCKKHKAILDSPSLTS